MSRNLRIMAAVIASASTMLAACGSDIEATAYSAENQEAFVTACTLPGEDPTVIRDVCECTYAKIAETIPFDEFVAIEESLQFDALTPLPDSIAELVAECFVEEADL